MALHREGVCQGLGGSASSAVWRTGALPAPSSSRSDWRLTLAAQRAPIAIGTTHTVSQMSSYRRSMKVAVREQLAKMSSNPDHVYVVHYSSEGFANPETGGSPRVTSIAVRNYSSGQTRSFSIHKFAELRHVPLNDIMSKYDELEKEMLESFYEYVRERKDASWVHWNMRDMNYGFAALEHRLSVLGGSPIEIEDQRKFDLSRALVTLYGRGYTRHPRIESLMAENRMTTKDFLSGEQEAAAFQKGEYIALHQSTLRKVDTFCSFLDGAIGRTLKTGSRWYERWDLYVVGDSIKNHWIVTIVSLVAAGLTVLFFALDVYSHLMSWLGDSSG